MVARAACGRSWKGWDWTVQMSLRGWVAVGLLAAVVGGVGLWYTVTSTWTTELMQGVFLTLLAVMLTGLTILLAAYLNHSFAHSNWLRHDPLRLLREGVGVALFGVLCGWLQKERHLSLMVAAIIAGVLALVETYFLTRDRR
jgi:hypothetical protein